MTDILILLILAVLLLLAVKSSLKHFKGEGGCCGGGSYKARPRKLNAVAERRIYRVEGMSCQHCVNRVMEAVQAFGGASCQVNLKKGRVTISLESSIPDEVLTAAIEKAGYTVAGKLES